MSDNVEVDANAVIDRIKETLEITTDIDLSKYFGLANVTVGKWRQRNKVPYDQAVIAAKRGREHLGWIITGVRDDSLYAGLLEGPVDHELMRVVLLDNVLSGRWSELLAGLPDKEKRAIQLARIVTTEYNKHNDMMREAVENDHMSKGEFLQSLQKAVESALKGTPPTTLIDEKQLNQVVFDAVRFAMISADENSVEFPMSPKELDSFATVVTKLTLGESQRPVSDLISEWQSKQQDIADQKKSAG